MEITITDVTVNDAKQLLEIYAPYVEKTAITFEYEVPTLNDFQKRIINTTGRYPYIKAVDENNQIVGYAYAGTFKGRRAYDWSIETSIYVEWNKRSMGIGKALYLELENRLKSMGITNMYACIAYTENEDEYLKNDSERFHETLGYKTIGTFHKCAYKFNRWYDMIWMEKFINDHTTIR